MVLINQDIQAYTPTMLNLGLGSTKGNNSKKNVVILSVNDD